MAFYKTHLESTLNRIRIHSIILLLVAVLAALSASWWKDTKAEFIFAAICIMIAGVPHGSLDHFVAGTTRNRFKLLPFLITYIATAGAYLLVWWLQPGIAFLFFLIITAWHFGETDLACFGAKKTSPLLTMLYGTAITLWLLMHDHATLLYWTKIVSRESAIAGTAMKWLTVVPHYAWYVIIALMLLLTPKNNPISLLTYLFFLAFLFILNYTSLITGFVLYFTGWHSMNALTHIREKVFAKSELNKVLVKALIPTLGAALLLAVIAWLGQGAWLEHNGLPALFVLLSVLTLPHMTEMHRLYTQSKS